MRPLILCVVVGTTLSALACSASRTRDPVEGGDEVQPPSAPAPQAAPRVWENEPSYRLGWPIRIKAGLLNTGEAIVNVPRGEFFGVKLRARRGEEELQCESIPLGEARGGLFPLATGSSAHLYVDLDQRCPVTQPGSYVVEVTVEVPPYEGSDVSGAQTPISVSFQVPAPEQPLVARLVAERLHTGGQPIEATLRITNYSAEPVRLTASSRILVRLRAESNGESVPCEAPTAGRAGRPADLAPGETREIPLVLTNRCQLTIAGTYTISATAEVPASGRGTFEGSLEAAPVVLEVSQPAEEPAEEPAVPPEEGAE